MAKTKYSQRKDGRYFTSVRTGKYNDDNGKPESILLYAKTSSQLDKLVRDTKYQIEHGTYAHDKGITFGNYAQKWADIILPSKSLRTRVMYNNIIKNHTSYIDDIRLKDLTRSDIQLQINQDIEYPRICQQAKMTIMQILSTAIEDGLIIKNPCKNIVLPRRVKKEQRVLTKNERDAIKHSDFTVKERAFIYILWGCGLRPAEMYALTRADVDTKKCEIKINKSLCFDKQIPFVTYPKTNSGIRTVQTPQVVMDAIKALVAESTNLILFSDENGHYMSRRAYYWLFEQIKRKIEHYCEISEAKTPLTQYTFRHNYCTELYYSGISLKEAQRLMGHADYSMIMKVYSHLDETKENTQEKLKKICL